MGLTDWPRAAYEQVRGFASNAYAYFADFAVDDVIPPGVRDFINWIISVYPNAFGVRNATPREQINASVVLLVFWGVWAGASLGLLIPIFVIHVPLLFIGIYRWMPAVNELWKRFRDWLPVKDDYNIPFWRSE